MISRPRRLESGQRPSPVSQRFDLGLEASLGSRPRPKPDSELQDYGKYTCKINYNRNNPNADKL